MYSICVLSQNKVFLVGILPNIWLHLPTPDSDPCEPCRPPDGRRQRLQNRSGDGQRPGRRPGSTNLGKTVLRARDPPRGVSLEGVVTPVSLLTGICPQQDDGAEKDKGPPRLEGARR